MERKSQQGQALRVLARSQPCWLFLSMLHLQVAKAMGLSCLRRGFSSRAAHQLTDFSFFFALPTQNSDEPFFIILMPECIWIEYVLIASSLILA